MLLQCENELSRRDRGIPALDLVLDPLEMAALLAQHLPASGPRPQLTKRYVRYKPGMNCLVRYSGQSGGRQFEAYAKAHGEDGDIKIRNARKRKSVAGPLGPGRLAIEDERIVFSFFPNDSKLRQLPDVIAAPWRRILEGAVADTAPDGELRLTTLAYKPERRFVARLDGPAGPLAVLKVYKPSSFAAAADRAGFGASMSYLPRLLHRSEELGTLELGWTPGRTLSEVIRAGGDAIDHTRRAGRVLAALHAAPPASGLVERTVDSEARVLRDLVEGVGWLVPASRDVAARLGSRVLGLLGAMPAVHCLVHGDFYANQVLLAREGIRILDSDELCLGHPAADLGLFIAHLEREVFCRQLSVAEAEALAEALIDGYASAGGVAEPRAVRVYTVFGMMQLAHRPFRDGEATWPARTLTWLHRCESLLGPVAPGAGSGRGRHRPAGAVSSGSPGDTTADPDMPFLADALDARRAGPMLAAALANGGDLGLRATRLIRHRPGRRALVEYELAGADPSEPVRVIGKVRARGMDQRTYGLMKALHATGLARSGPYSPGVPAPLGAVPDLGMWLQARVAGVPAWDGLAGPGGENLARGVAESLFALHRADVAPERDHAMADEIAILDAALERAADGHAGLAPRIRRVAGRCRELASAVDIDGRACGIHRDFYPDQVLVDGERIHLIDLDLYARGDPALDVGNFVAHLQEMSLRRRGDPLWDLSVQRAFVGRYVELNPGAGLVEAIDVYRVLTLARHIFISTRIPERNRFTESILMYCESQLA